MLDADEFGPRLLDRAQNLVELGLHRRAVAVLTVLDQEHGQKGEDGRRRVDDQLPGVGKMQQRAAHRPDEDEGHSGDEGRGLAHDMGASGCDAGEEMVHGYLRWNEGLRSEEHTSELQSLMRISYAVFCLKKKNKNK